jgi:tetratricopeptide (TPR) repeat protein
MTVRSDLANKIFISHTHADEAIANALDEAIGDLFGQGTVEVVYSTKKGRGGIRAGEDWYAWIIRQVRESRVALVLFTPASIAKPWLYWEAGAVYGSALAEASPDLRRVRPLLYGLRRNDVPTTFPTTQAARGDRREDMDELLTGLFDDFEGAVPRQVLLEAGRKLPHVLDTYLETVQVALRHAPLAPTEENVQEWCARLDRLREEDRVSEVQHIHDWMNVAFGSEDQQPMPIDLRLHRRLGELYLDVREYQQAADQFELARRLVPRDIFVLRALGQAYLGGDEAEAAGGVIDDIGELDPEAFAHNVECAALKGRWLLQRGRGQEAENVYDRAFEHHPDSYYLADLLGQVRLELGDQDGAREAYTQALEIIERLPEQNLWVEATAATAAVVAGDQAKALQHLQRARALQPTQENLDAIERGLRRCQRALGLGENAFAEWQLVLRS